MALQWKVKFKMISKRGVCISLISLVTLDFVSLTEARVGLAVCIAISIGYWEL